MRLTSHVKNVWSYNSTCLNVFMAKSLIKHSDIYFLKCGLGVERCQLLNDCWLLPFCIVLLLGTIKFINLSTFLSDFQTELTTNHCHNHYHQLQLHVNVFLLTLSCATTKVSSGRTQPLISIAGRKQLESYLARLVTRRMQSLV
jgi:hypothetical protein